jgi:hypothetical protein
LAGRGLIQVNQETDTVELFQIQVGDMYANDIEDVGWQLLSPAGVVLASAPHQPVSYANDLLPLRHCRFSAVDG